ncbi:glutathione S-transferase family protein [Parvularcula lutaonensis]|uniref:Glutathione S-transferase family protein n=1 Tax=Parvularcula lutaonensis TaxID=491923 RepID=A0ABV7MBF5_9PROT|nr:glutathione S-transferase family protein [Parvularcula lutaonensis]GGY36187.1 glutathione S-transferase [Parvularcula lutaonensis]
MTIKLHHLRVGRSVFTAWLLEELGLDYDLEIYIRNEMGRAPPELKDVHPLGKSPVIEVDGFTLAENAAIATYLVESHNPDGKFLPPKEGKARGQWLQWLHYPEGSAFAPLLIQLLLSRTEDPKPMLISMFAAGETALHLGYIRDQLGDNDFILGDEMTLPDFGVTYICHMADRLGLLADYPTLKAYAERNTARPAFQKAMEKTGG